MYLINKFVIIGSSMLPTLNPGDIVFASPLPYLFFQPKVHDIVICRDPRDGRELVKRLIRIEKSLYYVSGDNPAKSTDSRNFGPLARRDIIGKVIYKTQRSNTKFKTKARTKSFEL